MSVINTILKLGGTAAKTALGAAFPVASAIAGGASTLWGAIKGGVKSGEYNRKYEEGLQGSIDDNKRWHDIEMSKVFTERADVQADLKKQRELLEDMYKRSKATNTVVGGTDEALALQRQGMNKTISDSTTNIAAQSTAYKDAKEDQYRLQDAALKREQRQNYQQLGAAAAQAGSQVVNKGLDLLGNSLDPDNLKQTV